MHSAITQDEAQVLANTFNRNLGSPEECAARKLRMEAAADARNLRGRELSNARAMLRKHPIQTAGELLALLQCIHANIDPKLIVLDSDLKDAGRELLNFCTDLDSVLQGD